MRRMFFSFALTISVLSTAAAQDIKLAESDWPWWRGPNRNGVADPKQKPPLKWSETENILWKTQVPGKGHGSPIVVGNHVYLATADHNSETQSMLCYDRNTGKLIWHTPIHKGGFAIGGNEKSTLASATAACDGERVFITFLHDKAIWASALGARDGKLLWQTKVADYVLHQGFGSSPTVYKSLLLVSADNKGTGVLAGLNRLTGEITWKVERPMLPNYASPIVLKVAGKEQLFFTGCKLVTSLDPLTGKKNWETEGSTEETVTSTVTDGQHIVISGGFPKNHVAVLKADGSGKTVWENGTKVYVPSMLEHRGYLYAVQDAGVAMCWKFDTGKEIWKGRLDGKFTASPVLVGEHIYATSETGRTFIFRVNPEVYDPVGQNQLGTEAMATPTICGGRIYMRLAGFTTGQRQEMLYCIGQAK
ncbi:MAG: PQQ-binding-like beta-propeller repeat protein [Planctomycetes bacterium]|nr:PQQ-binding-like beta-propeller repeat protein [Planctomycetota bacterium]